MFKYKGFKVTFKHIPQNRKTIQRLNEAGQHIPFVEKTVCSIYRIDHPDDAPVVGVAMCSLKDQFDKTTGREIAFARAMHQVTGDKAERLQWWRAFWVSDDGVHTDGSAVAWLAGVISTDEVTNKRLEEK